MLMCRYLKVEEKKITHHRIKNAAARDKYLSLSLLQQSI